MNNQIHLLASSLLAVLVTSTFAYPTPASADPTPAQMTANQAAPVAEPNAIFDARFPSAGLSLVAATGLTQITSSEGKVDFGRVSVLKTPVLMQTFRLKNTTSKTLTLDHLQTSCHCTSAAWEMKSGKLRPDTDTTPLTLLPGKSVAVDVRLNLTQMAPGQVVKSVMVFLKGQTQPAALVTLVADVQPVVSFWPHQLDFGQVQTGTPRTLTLTAAFDPHLASAGAIPALISSDPDINIKPSAHDTILQGGTISRTYTLTLAPTTAEPLSGTLSFQPPAAAKSAPMDAAKNNTAAQAALSNISVSVQGQIIGAVAAEPSALALGPIPGKHSKAATILLTGQTEQTLIGAVVKSQSPYLFAHLEGNQSEGSSAGHGTQGDFSGSGPSANCQMLVITVLPDTPLGKLQSQVRVTLASGQVLLVPVTAYVIAANAL